MAQLKYLALVLITLMLVGCFPERHPTNPLQYETRRPQIAYFVPMRGVYIVDDGDSLLLDPTTPAGEPIAEADAIQIWFDELMDQSSIGRAFRLTLAVQEAPWTRLGSVGAAAMSASDPHFLLVGLQKKGAFYSSDGGTSWKFLLSLAQRSVKFFQIDPTNPATIYADTDSTLLKSSDGGVTWQKITSGLPQPLAIMRLDFDPVHSHKLWLATTKGLYRSENGGQSWQPAGVLPGWREDRTITKICVDPFSSTTLYCATLGRYLYKSNDGGTTWEMKRNGLPTSQIYDLVLDPDDGAILYAATINRGVYKSTDGGENWFETNVGLIDVNARKLAFESPSGKRLFVVTPNRVFASTDKAGKWEEILLPSTISGILHFFIDGSRSGTMVVASASSVFKTENNGERWQEIDRIDPTSIEVSGTFNYTLWQGTQKFIRADGDTVVFAPHRYNDVLAMYDAGLAAAPPPGIDPNPKATRLYFRLNAPFMLSNWMYHLTIRGAFEGSQWRGDVAPKDIHGMSLEYDFVVYMKSR